MTASSSMHVAVIKSHQNGKTYSSVLLRQSYRDHNNRVQKRTLANLSHLPPHTIPLLRGALAGKQYAEVGDVLGDPVRSRHHGAVQAVRTAMNAIGLPRLVARERCPERELVLAMVAGRILRPNSKLATNRWWRNTTLPQEFAIADDVTADDLYAAMDWLNERQEGIQRRLARRWIAQDDLVLWDLSSTWYEGSHCPLARFGYSRDRKRGVPQINFGLLCDRDGRPVAVTVYPGNIADKETLLPELDRLQRRFSLSRVVMVGDRGMIIKATIAALRARDGAEWITALKSQTIRKLARQGHLDRFQDPEHEQTLFEIRDHPDFPKERLVACRNPRLAGHRDRVRQELLKATEKALAEIVTRVEGGTLKGEADIGLAVGEVINKRKVKKHFHVDITGTSFSFRRKQQSIDAEAALDGIYIIRTSLGSEDMAAAECVRNYKRLTRVERAFRCLKLSDLQVRPIFHRLEHRVRAHFFICMLAYLVEWHMRNAWAPLCYTDTEPDETGDPVLPARRSEPALTKVHTHTLPDGSDAHSFRTLLDSLSTIVRSSHAVPRTGGGNGDATIEVTTRPDAGQERALKLLKDIEAM
ncbi:MAG: IS1634 family transposase [Rhodospirillales bacterium]|nr:IS1634 family transposase [Rhodospirillales bacterium]